MATMSFSATKKDDATTANTGEKDIASATSKITALSLRIGTQLTWMMMEPLGMTFGLNMLVPLAGFSKSFSGSVTDDNQDVLPDKNGISDLESSVDHKLASFGAEVLIAAFWAF